MAGIAPIKAALLGAAFLFAALSACSTSGSFRSAQEIAVWARQHGFAEANQSSGPIRFATFTRKQLPASDTLVIYIEGDGAAWSTPYHPPRDPTPTNPVALGLAIADPAAAVVYLGRPCQYLDEEALRSCDSAYWTERRFAPEVVLAYDELISRQKSAVAARRLRLFGYSGGGVLATLLAAQRDDVELLVTVAAPLALAEWVAWHEATPLKGSIDPAELRENIRLPRSQHFAGGSDKTVPSSIVEAFIRRKGGRIETIPGFDHECCWVRDWARLLGRVNVQENAR